MSKDFLKKKTCLPGEFPGSTGGILKVFHEEILEPIPTTIYKAILAIITSGNFGVIFREITVEIYGRIPRSSLGFPLVDPSRILLPFLQKKSLFELGRSREAGFAPVGAYAKKKAKF